MKIKEIISENHVQTLFAEDEKIEAEQFRKWMKMPGFLKHMTIVKVPGFGITNGALAVKYKDIDLGYIGFPLSILENLLHSPIVKWLERGHDKQAEEEWGKVRK